MISEVLTEKKLASILRKNPPRGSFAPASDRAAWKKVARKKLNADLTAMIRKTAEYLLKCSGKGNIYPEIPLASIFAYQQTGSRGSEGPYFRRRNTLSILVLAECMEYKGRFLPLIEEGLWAIMSEPFWFVAAHGDYNPPDPMPAHIHKTDLFSCETAMTLAQTMTFLEPELKKRSPNLVKWVYDLVDERVISFIETMGTWWLNGYGNWCPWCCSNSAGAAIVFLKDQPERLAKFLLRLAGGCDRFYDSCAPDGGCDEGPDYFQVAGLKLMNFLEHLDNASGGAYAKCFEGEKMRNIAEFFFRVRLTGNWNASMADSAAYLNRCRRGLLCRFAERVHSSDMYSFVLHENSGYAMTPEAFVTSFGSILFELASDLFMLPEKTVKKIVKHPAFTALPDMQFFVMRDHPENDRKGMIFCMKGGHNAEHHNHNDVGEFELFFDGSPVIVDPGAASYTRFTFSEKRYDSIWYSAAGHNPPIVNRVLQPAGKEYAAKVLKAQKGLVQLELTNAYPDKAKLLDLKRTAKLEKGCVSILDEFRTSGKKALPVGYHFFTPVKPVREKDFLKLGKVRLLLENAALSSIEEIVLDDPKLRNVWKRLFKVTLTAECREKLACRFTFEA